ncbi:MAG: hypothetical protein SW833_19270 [Cyanobacteriota bacterium]|nr:hypothetical protein [Cyanobacteriota bacterium]
MTHTSLRPLSAGNMVNAAFRLYRGRFKLYLLGNLGCDRSLTCENLLSLLILFKSLMLSGFKSKYQPHNPIE